MNIKIKNVIKNIVPPIISSLISKKNIEWGWFGKYHTWEDANKNSSGYDEGFILDKKIKSLSKIKNGDAEYELDTIIYKNPIYNFPLLYSLSYISNNKSTNLNIIDFGGSLSSTYYWVKKLLNPNITYQWFIIEQKHIVEIGQKEFEQPNLKFIPNFEFYHSTNLNKPDILLLSGVIQYLEDIKFIFDEVEKHQYPYIILDRTPFFENEDIKEAITIQKVPAHYYGKETTLPCKIYNQRTFIDNFKNYELIINSESFDRVSYLFYGNKFHYRFMFFKRLKNI